MNENTETVNQYKTPAEGAAAYWRLLKPAHFRDLYTATAWVAERIPYYFEREDIEAAVLFEGLKLALGKTQ